MTPKTNSSQQDKKRPSHEDAMAAIRTLIAYAGDDPKREGLLDTPDRVARAYSELFKGYTQSPDDDLSRTFEEVEGYQDIVLLKDIPFHSHCEHHMMPFIGTAHIAYLPKSRVVGISKLARVVDIYARRLQSQETMTMEIADAINRTLEPNGVAVIISAEHFCMTMRGVKKPGVMTITRHFHGVFLNDPAMRQTLQSML